MSNTIQSIPEARLLLASLRSVGYSEETAIADIIDNCITAEANIIDILFDWEHKRISTAWFSIRSIRTSRSFGLIELGQSRCPKKVHADI